MGGAYPLYEPLPDCILAPTPLPFRQEGVDGETTMETRGDRKGLPLYDFRSFPTFLGELDSRYQSFTSKFTSILE